MKGGGKTEGHSVNEVLEESPSMARLGLVPRLHQGTSHTRNEAEDTLRLILNLSTNFLTLPSDEIDDGINDVLKMVGEFSSVDRFYIFQLCDDGEDMNNTHEWCARGVEPLMMRRQRLLMNDLPPFFERLRSFEIINIPDVDAAMEEITVRGEPFFGGEVQSTIIVPMVYGIDLIGFLGFDCIREKRFWSEYIVALLKIVGETFANALVRKRTEESLRESEGNYRNIFDHAVEGIFQSTPDDRYVSVNPALARMLGYESPAEVIEEVKSIEEQLYVNRQDYRDIKRLLAAQGYVEGFETKFYRKDGSQMWVSLNARAVRNGNDSILYYEGFHQDITSRKRSDQALQRSLEGMQRTLDGTVKALATTIEMRDPYTAGHQKRVVQLASMIAEEMGLPKDRVEGIRVMGFLHDIGKIVVPAEILSKPGKLTEYEFQFIKAHAQAGYDILKDIELPWPVATAIIQHHEKLDGSGYPRGLSGEEIILEARILCVADVMEAMASHRPYRPALGVDVALEEITKEKGTLYDPEVVDICVRIFREKRFQDRW
jgi:PAS domain S-box-containing protein/putative nucleotidyltransferase with HDIG domain